MNDNQQTIELTYPCHTIGGTRFICGRALAKELIADALKLLAPVHAGNMDAAWQEFWHVRRLSPASWSTRRRPAANRAWCSP